ncbi:ABC transporter ATP-binding protein [Phyllobacterium sp. SB3]|uniref:ABC transporter ATP-binding protein n=1 Tax=Phyllobacterium sp. SB3 TaxID=3156073 RepID=UPI0032B019C8
MIRLDHLTKFFGAFIAVDDITLDLPAGEICVLLGPSGCGKTTTMKMINRLIQPSSGKVFIDGRDTSGINPIELRRSIGYVIQQVGLFPNKTIADNICIVPDLLGWDHKRSRARAKELLELVGMQPDLFLKRYPKELSGGQQQRVGVLRALAADPPVMLMDEPFGAIDPINREVIQDEFLKMQREIRKTIIFVSHDLDEAVKMADKIAIFRSGRLEQYASPDELLARPANAFIENFLGSDRALKRLRLVSVSDAMSTSFDSVKRDEPVVRAHDLMRASGLPAVLVVNPDGVADAVVTKDVANGASGSVADHAKPIGAAVSVNADLRNAVALMFGHDMPVLPCIDDAGRLKGVMTYRSIVRNLGGGDGV